VYVAVTEAVKRARAGKGPTLIENITYRLENHTTSDDASRYRSDAEVKKWWKKEPILRLRNYLITTKKWSQTKEKKLLEDFSKKIEAAVSAYEASSPPPVEDMFKYMYEQMTPLLAEQLEDVKRFAK